MEPFDQHSDKETEIRDLIHIDLWGKYSTASIHSNQYYLLMVDDSSQYITTEFLKKKTEAADKIKNYIMQLISHNRKPKAIRIDRGQEFLNEQLSAWCHEKGMNIEVTAPYSPSQNGIAERMNQTLVEIAHAMLRGLPEFLWKYAVQHSSYLRNRSYTKALQNQTPYQKWFNIKPNVSHLRESGAPVWVLLQGQKKLRKMEPKSRQRIFVSYEDGSKSIKYYNAQTRKVLTSCNIRFLALTDTETPSEPMVLLPDGLREGEPGSSTLPTSDNTSDSLKKGNEISSMKVENRDILE